MDDFTVLGYGIDVFCRVVQNNGRLDVFDTNFFGNILSVDLDDPGVCPLFHPSCDIVFLGSVSTGENAVDDVCLVDNHYVLLRHPSGYRLLVQCVTQSAYDIWRNIRMAKNVWQGVCGYLLYKLGHVPLWHQFFILDCDYICDDVRTLLVYIRLGTRQQRRNSFGQQGLP